MESRESLIPGSKQAGVRVELQEVTEYTREAPVNSSSFFHWVKDRDTRGVSIWSAKIVPWKGLSALFISILTTAASFGLLLYMERKRELMPTTGMWKVMQPASLISALMSINGAALHIALLEGVTVAWWYRATRPTANLEQLHSLWATGTSSFEAALNLQKLSYVSLAALFVAILPLNSFLLQAAITTPMTLIQKSSIIPVPMRRTLPRGYSAYWADTNDTWGALNLVDISNSWSGISQQIKNIAGSKYAGYAYFGAYDQCDIGATSCTDTWTVNETHPTADHLLGPRYYLNDTASVFSFRAQGVGFNVSCENSTVPYNLTYVEDGPTRSSPLFLNTVLWDHDDPNVITMEMRWKQSSSCVGAYERRFCTLKAATVEYPVEMSLDVAGKYRGPYFSLPVNTTWHNDKVIAELPVYEGDSQTPKDTTTERGVSTYGGIALTFSEWYDANLTWVFDGVDGWSAYKSGPLAYAVDPGYWDPDNSDSTSSLACTISMNWGLSYLDYFEQMSKRGYKDVIEMGPLAYTDIGSPIDLVLNQIRQSMFLASVYEGAGYWSRSFASNVSTDLTTFARPANNETYIQTVEALRTKTVPVYNVRWGLWGASVAMTFGVILLILPTFFGFCMFLLNIFARTFIANCHQGYSKSSRHCRQLMLPERSTHHWSTTIINIICMLMLC